jgi:acyl dehydratase
MAEFFPDQVHVGQDLGGREFAIPAEDVARYREGTANDAAAASPAPPLLYHSEVYRRLDWYLANIIGNLHARQEWELFAPLRVGDVVRSHSTVVERYRKRNRDYVVNEVLFTDADGRWLQRSRTHQSFLADDPGPDMVVDRDRERRGDRRFALPEGDGEEFASRPTEITHAMCTAFSGPTRNYHTDVEMARALGFPDIVVQGMLSVCFVADLMTGRFGDGFHAGGKLDVRLVNVVWPRDVITTRGKIRETVREGSRRRHLADVWCEKADGTVTLIGTASALA